MMRRQILAAAGLVKLAQIARLDNDPQTMKLIEAVSLSKNPRRAEQVAQYLNLQATQQLVEPIPFYKPRGTWVSHRNHPRIVGLGTARGCDEPYIIEADLLTRHVLIVGSSGAGKTNLLHVLIRQATCHAKVWAFDRIKTDFRNYAASGFDVLSLQNTFAWNPFEVQQGFTPSETITRAVENLGKSFDLLIASRSVLGLAVHQLYETRGVYCGSRDFPTMWDLRNQIAQSRKGGARSAQYVDTILNRLDAMLWEAPKTYSFQKGFPIEELARRHVVFECGGLSEHHGRFLAMNILGTLAQQRLHEEETSPYLRNFVVIDEAAWLAPPSGSVDAAGWSPLSEVLRAGREGGISLCFASQTTHLDDAILENSHSRFVFLLGHGADIARIKTALSLDDDQARYISRLRVGECIASISPERPFLLTIPRIER